MPCKPSGRAYSVLRAGCVRLDMACQWCSRTDRYDASDALRALSAASQDGWKPMVGDYVQAWCGACDRDGHKKGPEAEAPGPRQSKLL
jgi:hypothetical protein